MEKDSDIPQLKVALYIRVSTDDQVEKYGPDLQRDALEALVKSKGKLSGGENAMVIAGDQYIYFDDGVSGTVELDERPAFSRLKEDILFAEDGNKPFDVVAVYKDVIDFFEKHNVQFVSANESIDTSTPFGKAMLGIIGVIAELEIETIRQRTQAGRIAAMKKGVVMGATPPFGYIKNEVKNLVVFEEEAKVIRLIYDKFVNERYTIQQIANYLTENEYLTPDASVVKHQKRLGKIQRKNDATFWRPERVRETLQDEIYIGRYYYGKSKKGKKLQKNEWQLSEYEHENIIDLVLFTKAQYLLESTKYIFADRSKHSDHLYLLTGLLRCNCCREFEKDEDLMTWTGSRKKLIKGVNKGEFSYSYICGRKNRKKYSRVCEAMPIPADELENYIVSYTKKLLKNPVAVYNHQQRLKSSRIETQRQ